MRTHLKVPTYLHVYCFSSGIRESSLKSIQLPVRLVDISVGEKLTWPQMCRISTQEIFHIVSLSGTEIKVGTERLSYRLAQTYPV